MTSKPPTELNTPTPTNKLDYSKHHHHQRTNNISSLSFCSPKLSLYLLATFVTLSVIYQIQFLRTLPPPPPPPTSSTSWSLMHQWQKILNFPNCTQEPKSITEKLRHSVTFLPLKDLRYADKALQGHTWFMSSMYDTHEEGEVQYQQFPSESSKGRLLCLKGHDTQDGSWNSYALAWPDALPYNTTLMKGLTFVSYNHYIYDNIWHGLSAVVPFVAWHRRNECELPTRWILYHRGELRFKMGTWLGTLMEATFDGAPHIEGFGRVNDGEPVCFEKAVVMRHNEGGMSRDRRMEVYDLMRCKARMYCNVSLEGVKVGDQNLPVIGMTLFMRTGPRSFRNESEVIRIFERECGKVEGCRLLVALSNNLSFCEQVKVMSMTDILISPHGAQLTNLFLMDRNSSVMELFPKGWLKLAGVGQYVYHWLAGWSGMRHQGTWRDPKGDKCPYPEDDRRCMSIYKSGKIGYNETYFAEWTRNVLNEVRARKMEEASTKGSAYTTNGCACTSSS